MASILLLLSTFQPLHLALVCSHSALFPIMLHQVIIFATNIFTTAADVATIVAAAVVVVAVVTVLLLLISAAATVTASTPAVLLFGYSVAK